MQVGGAAIGPMLLTV